MSRTREINVYLNRFENFDNASISYKKCDTYCVKAKLIIELPERKVTISESELLYAIRYSGFAGDEDNAAELKARLFKDTE